MSNTNEKMNERLQALGGKKGDIDKSKRVLEKIIHQEEEKPDLSAIAQELQERNEREAKGENEGYVKATIYIQEDVYNAFEALCLRRGDKKKFANEAFLDFVLKKHKELKDK